jgi:hypothetical protein
MRDYTGVVIMESLVSSEVLDSFETVSTRTTTDPTWHLVTVRASREEITQIARRLRPGPWYAHFWKGRALIAAFASREFEFHYDDRQTWTPVIEYGLSIGIPIEQLDFPIP